MGFITGWALTIFGPLLFKAKAFIPGLNVLHAIKVGGYVLALGFVAFGGWAMHSWWRGAALTEVAAQQKCDHAIAEAEVLEKRKALDAREAALKLRESVVEADETSIASQIEAMREIRDASSKVSNSPTVFVRDDDAWLRAWRGRQMDRAGGAGPRPAALPRP